MMGHATKKEREEFVAVLTRECEHLAPTRVADSARHLMRWAATYKRLMVDLCNTGEYDADKLARAKQVIANLTKELEVEAVLSGDPRGWTVKLILPSGRSNSMGGEGWGVPTS